VLRRSGCSCSFAKQVNDLVTGAPPTSVVTALC
jgi:hypothetical protein